MGIEEVEVLLRFSDPSVNIREVLLSNRKYVNGLAIRSEELVLRGLKALSGLTSEELNPVLLVRYFDSVKEALIKYVNTRKSKVYLELGDPSRINGLPKDLSSKVIIGIKLMHPAPNLLRLAKLGIKFISMPPALIRGRIIREASSRGVTLIADTVNDASTFIKLAESGVKVVITDHPAIKRDAKKIAKL